MAAFTSAVTGKAIVNGEIKGNVITKRPVPITNGDAARVKKLTISIACEVV